MTFGLKFGPDHHSWPVTVCRHLGEVPPPSETPPLPGVGTSPPRRTGGSSGMPPAGPHDPRSDDASPPTWGLFMSRRPFRHRWFRAEARRSPAEMQ